jgi:leader peptidase (prepilin peptidase)/N-methyltransferase
MASVPEIDALRIAFGGVLAGLLLVLAASDARTMLLPDRFNLLLAGGGLGQNLVIGLPGLRDAFLGSVIGGGLLGLLAAAFRRLRGREGLGLGDVKLVSAAGLWIGWQGVPMLLSIASLAALAAIAARAVLQEEFDRAALMPFGPFLALGTLVTWLSLALN